MKKKIAVTAMVITIIIQLAVPCFAMYQKYDVVNNGKVYSFDVAWFTTYDCEDYCLVSLTPADDLWYYESKYLVIKDNTEGYAYVEKQTNIKPASEDYIINKTYWFPFGDYQIDKKLYEKVYSLSCSETDKLDVNVRVAIKNGMAVMLGVYVGDQPLEQYVA